MTFRLAAVGLLLLLACRSEVPKGAAAFDDAMRRLALAPPNGHSSIDRMVERWQRAVEKSPTSPDAWVQLGHAWVRKARASMDPGFYLSADAAAAKALELSPDSRAALGLRALVMTNEHRFAEARALAEAVLAKDPDDVMALAVLSDAALELGDFDAAVRAAQRMVDVKPNLPSYSRASYLRWLMGDAAGAKAFIRSAIDSGRDSRDVEPWAWALVQAANLFWHEGDYAGARAGYEQALSLVPDYAPALVGKGRVALAMGNARDAAAVLERAYRTSPAAETAWVLGDARAAMGDERGAAEAYAWVERDGRRADPLTLASFYAAKSRNVDEALKLLEAERKKRRGLYVEDAWAWALYRAGRLDEAKAASDRALRWGTKDATLLFHAGAIRIALGERDEGLELVRRALALNPRFDFTGTAEAAALLERSARAEGGVR